MKALSSMDSSFCENVGDARISGSRLEWDTPRWMPEMRGERRTGLPGTCHYKSIAELMYTN